MSENGICSVLNKIALECRRISSDDLEIKMPPLALIELAFAIKDDIGGWIWTDQPPVHQGFEYNGIKFRPL